MFLPLLLACPAPAPPTPPPPPSADLVAIGDVSVVVVDGRIAAVHDDPRHARARVGPDTVLLEAQRITPGFVDAHLHPVGLGATLEALDLSGAGSYAAALERVATAGGAGQLVGRGWDQNDWPDTPDGGWPLAADLDRVAASRPIVLTRIDGHAVWLSSAALAQAGIDASTPDPPGGRIVRGDDGAPTGVLIDNAMDLLPEVPPTEAQLRRWAIAAGDALAGVGLTGVHAMGIGDATLAVLAGLDAEQALPVRVWAYVDPDTEAARRLADTGPWRGDRLEVVGVKAYADGALGSRGALLSEDYADEPGHRGLVVTPAEELEALAVRLTGAGAQLAIHAIGDQGVSNALDAFAAAAGIHPTAAIHHRVEHAQVVHPDDVSRFASLGVIASMQPTHATSDMPWASDRLGAERTGWAYAWRTLSDAGAILAFGSDAPVEDPSPALGLWAALTRTDARGHPTGGWHPGQRLAEAEAIAAFTLGAARAVHASDRLGSLQVGKLADLSLWSIDGARFAAVATVVEGEVIWRAPQ